MSLIPIPLSCPSSLGPSLETSSLFSMYVLLITFVYFFIYFTLLKVSVFPFNNVCHSFLEHFIIITLKLLIDISDICASLTLHGLNVCPHIAEVFLVLYRLDDFGLYLGHFEYYIIRLWGLI